MLRRISSTSRSAGRRDNSPSRHGMPAAAARSAASATSFSASALLRSNGSAVPSRATASKVTGPVGDQDTAGPQVESLLEGQRRGGQAQRRKRCACRQLSLLPPMVVEGRTVQARREPEPPELDKGQDGRTGDLPGGNPAGPRVDAGRDVAEVGLRRAARFTSALLPAVLRAQQLGLARRVSLRLVRIQRPGPVRGLVERARPQFDARRVDAGRGPFTQAQSPRPRSPR